MGGRMKNDIGPQVQEESFESSGFTNVKDYGRYAERGRRRNGLHRFEDAGLAAAEQDQFPWGEARELSHKLTPDRAAGTRNKNPLPAESLADGGQINPGWRTSQKIFDIDLS
jgi:hypothetical protein